MGMNKFHVFTVGWVASIIKNLAMPVAELNGIAFTYGMVGNPSGVSRLQSKFPDACFVSLSKHSNEPLPVPDYALLASLESEGVPTIKSMIQGDSTLRDRQPKESLGYATLLAHKMEHYLATLKPDLVLSTFDNLHSSLSLAVAKKMGIPWVAMTFTAIPGGLTGFCKGVTPENLVPITRKSDQELKAIAQKIIANVRKSNQQIIIYRKPLFSTKTLRVYVNNVIRRIFYAKNTGFDRYICPTMAERIKNIVSRSTNALFMPARHMIKEPPQNQFIYFPIHMQPESTIDVWGVFYRDQLALIRQISSAMPADVQLVVKLHPSDPGTYTPTHLKRLMSIPGVLIGHPGSSTYPFLRRSSAVMGIYGTACLEAALLGKPVIMFGDSPYLHFPNTEAAKPPDKLFEQIARMLRYPKPNDEAIIAAFANYMARYLPGRVNDWTTTITEAEMGRLAACFRQLQDYLELPENLESWYRKNNL